MIPHATNSAIPPTITAVTASSTYRGQNPHAKIDFLRAFTTAPSNPSIAIQNRCDHETRQHLPRIATEITSYLSVTDFPQLAIASGRKEVSELVTSGTRKEKFEALKKANIELPIQEKLVSDLKFYKKAYKIANVAFKCLSQFSLGFAMLSGAFLCCLVISPVAAVVGYQALPAYVLVYSLDTCCCRCFKNNIVKRVIFVATCALDAYYRKKTYTYYDLPISVYNWSYRASFLLPLGITFLGTTAITILSLNLYYKYRNKERDVEERLPAAERRLTELKAQQVKLLLESIDPPPVVPDNKRVVKPKQNAEQNNS